jgi:hypothetical protein
MNICVTASFKLLNLLQKCIYIQDLIAGFSEASDSVPSDLGQICGGPSGIGGGFSPIVIP